MNKTTISVSISLLLTVALFYYIISIYQTIVPGTAKWLVRGRIERAAAAALAGGQNVGA